MNKYTAALFKIFIFFIPILIYAPVFKGTGIWDDSYFIFDRFQFQNLNHFIFWKNSVWPFFDSLTLILFKLFGTNTLPWHMTNFLVHILNGLLVGLITARYKPQIKYLAILIFWVHPLCVLSVGWIIQLKTLISMFFCLLAFFLVQLESRKKGILVLSLLFFALSVTSKSSTVLVPFLILFWCLMRKNWRVHSLKTLPFIVISILSIYRLSWNDFFQESVKLSESTIPNMIVDVTQGTIDTDALIAVHETTPEGSPEETVTSPLSETSEQQARLPEPNQEHSLAQATSETAIEDEVKNEVKDVVEVEVKDSVFINKLKIIAYTTTYYLAAPWLPYDLSPIHSSYRGGFHFKNYFGLGIIFISMSLVFFKHYWASICLISQIFLLLPFLGLVIAPYMKFSIVSEQHLYVALPFAILAQILFIQKVSKGYQKVVKCVFVIVLSVLTASYTPTFKSEESFYRRALHVYPYDRLSALNLANYYFKRGSIRQADLVLKKALDQAEEFSYLKEDVMHEYIIKTYERIQAL